MPSVDPVDVDAVAFADLTDAHLREWSSLASSALVANPFFEPASQMPAAAHLKPDVPAFLIFARRGEEMIGAMPVRLQTLGAGPLRLRVANPRVRGTGYAVGLGSPHLRRDAVNEAADGLVDALCQWSERGGPGVALLDWLDDDSRGTGDAVRDACRRRDLVWRDRAEWERPVARRTATGLSLEQTLGKETLRQLRKRQRRMERELGGEARIVDRCDRDAVESFLALEASGWKGRDARGMAYARSAQTADWFRETCANFAELGRLHLLSLQVGDRILAMQCCIVTGSDAFFFRVGHDDSLRRHGLGVLVQFLGVEHLSAMDVDMVDSCADARNDFLSGLYPDRRRLISGVIATGGAADREVVRLFPVAQRGVRLAQRLRTDMSRGRASDSRGTSGPQDG